MNGRVLTYNQLLTLTRKALLLSAAGFCIFAQDQPPTGSPAEMAELARKYEKGLGCPRDIGKALLYYKRAAAQGNPDAMVALGDLYREGVCVDQDLRFSTEMYQRAALAGFPPGLMRYGEKLEADGRRADAIPWFRKAASRGYGPAMTHLGDILADVEWYRRAVMAKHPPAFAKLAENVRSDEATDLLRRGAELGDPVAQAKYAVRIESRDPEGALKLWRAAAEAGEPLAMSRLASVLEKRGNAGDALMWYTKSAKAEDPDALYWMAQRAAESGRTDEAREMLRTAASKGHTGAMGRLAKLTGNPRMLKAAAEAGDPDAIFAVARENNDSSMMQRAADLGNAEALAAVGRTEDAAAKGHVPSLLKLGRWKEAADRNSPEGLYRWGLQQQDKAEGTRYISRAASAGYPAAMRDLAIRLESGSGIAADPNAALEWFRKAAAAGDPVAQFRLGDEGSLRAAAEANFLPAMVKLAQTTGEREWLEKAAAAGYVPAWTKLGEVDKAAGAGDPEAKVLLADRTKKSREAYRLYLEAAEAGYLPAMRKLAECHIQGRGTSVSEIDGINWYRKAAQAGDPESLAILKKLGKTLY